MQVWVSVNEADIDHIKPGAEFRFTCDAPGGETFIGTVGKVRLNAQSSQNVVRLHRRGEYRERGPAAAPVHDGPRGIRGAARKKKLFSVVPNAALLWRPSSAAAAAAVRPGEFEDGSGPG